MKDNCLGVQPTPPIRGPKKDLSLSLIISQRRNLTIFPYFIGMIVGLVAVFICMIVAAVCLYICYKRNVIRYRGYENI